MNYELRIRNRDARSKGFTMIELLVYISLIGVVSVVIGSAFISLSKSEKQVELRNEVQSNLLFAVQKIEQDVHNATAIATPASVGATASTLDMTVNGSQVQYCVVSSQLRRSTGPTCNGSSPVITTTLVTVNSLNFVRVANTNSVLSKTYSGIQTSISMTYNSTAPDQQYTVSKRLTTISYY